MNITIITSTVKQLRQKNIRRLGLEFSWVVLGQVLAMIGALVGIRIVTSLLPPAIYGQLALGLTISTLFHQVLFGPLSASTLRFFSSAMEARSFSYFLLALRGLSTKIAAGITIIGGIACLGMWSLQYREWIGLGVVAICFSLTTGYNSISNSLHNAARQRPVVALHESLSAWGRFSIAAGLVIWLGASSTVAMLGYLIAGFLVLLSQILFFRKNLLPPEDLLASTGAEDQIRSWNAKLVTYAWPFAAWGIFIWMQTASGRWALYFLASLEDVGYFAVLFQIGYYPITILTSFVSVFAAPIFFKRAGDATDMDRVRAVYVANWWLILVVLVLSIVASIIAFAFHAIIFDIMVSEEFHNASYLLPGCIFSAGLFATSQFASLSLLSARNSRELMAPKIITAIIGTVLNFCGAAWNGIAGVVVANIAFSLIQFLWIIYLIIVSHRKLSSVNEVK